MNNNTTHQQQPDQTKTQKKKKSKLMRLLTLPIRVLSGARDIYVKSMTNYADHAPYAGAGAGFGTVGQPLPRSFSVVSTRSNGSDDLTELIRAVSTRDYGDKIDVDSILPPTTTQQDTPSVSRSGSIRNTTVAPPPPNGLHVGGGDKVIRASSTGRLMKPPLVPRGVKVPRSASVGMGKIDEDKPIDKFEEDDKKKSKKKGKKNKDDGVRKESALFPRNRSYAYPGTRTPTSTSSTTTAMPAPTPVF